MEKKERKTISEWKEWIQKNEKNFEAALKIAEKAASYYGLEAEEVLSEAFLCDWREKYSLQSFIFGVAWNYARRLRKRKRRFKPLPEDYENFLTTEDAFGGEDEEELKAFWAGVMQKLTPAQQKHLALLLQGKVIHGQALQRLRKAILSPGISPP